MASTVQQAPRDSEMINEVVSRVTQGFERANIP